MPCREMTSRERVICSLSHRQPDRLPFFAGYTSPMSDRMVAFTGDPGFASALGGDLVQYEAYGRWEDDPPGYPPGHVRDPFGVVWNRSGADKDIGVIVGAVIPDIADNRYVFPAVDEARIRSDMDAFLAASGDRFTVAGIGFSLFERAWTLCTMPEVLMAMLAEPDALDALLDAIVDYDLRVLDILCSYPVDCIRLGDDWGQQRGLIMGPTHWRRFLKPRLARLYARIHAAGKFTLQHSCGDIREVLGDLCDIGLDCYETFQPEIYDFADFKARYGDRLSILGGVSTQQCLPCCTPDEVKAETARLLRVIGKDGGLIAAPTHAIPPDVSPENVLAMFDVFRHQDRYL